jgi:maltose-binding protein MalE
LGALREAMGNDLGVAALPSIFGQPMRSYFSTHVLTFPGDSLSGPKRTQLLALMTYMQSELLQRMLWQKMQVLPVNNKLLRELDQIGNPQLHTLIEQLNQSIPLPNSGEMAIVWEAMGIGFRRYIAEIVGVEEATELMQHLAETSINNHAGRAR